MKILLLGLGRANTGVARYCIKRGDVLFLHEDNITGLSSEARSMIEQGAIKIHKHIDYDCAVTSPGFPLQTGITEQLRRCSIPVLDEIEFTYQELDNPTVIAVTGTNGKSTTAALIDTVLKAAGKRTFLGGNLAPGKPFSQALFEEAYEFYVLEVSSFQLMRIEMLHPYVAVLTNISKDHMNWHQDMNEYQQAKLRIFKNQTPDDIAVLNHDDPIVRNLTQDIVSHKVYFGESAFQGAHCNGSFCFGPERLFPCSITPLRGKHNALNVLAVVAVAKSLNLENQALEQGVLSFKTLPHRLENCGTHDGVRYINNSMCTNEQAAIMSFRAIQGPKIVIVGGKEKGDAASKYLGHLAHNAKACIILGENAASIKAVFSALRYNQYAVAQTMEEAVQQARSFSESGDTILLNPGFASFGLFRNFEERGEAFKNAACSNR